MNILQTFCLQFLKDFYKILIKNFIIIIIIVIIIIIIISVQFIRLFFLS